MDLLINNKFSTIICYLIVNPYMNNHQHRKIHANTTQITIPTHTIQFSNQTSSSHLPKKKPIHTYLPTYLYTSTRLALCALYTSRSIDFLGDPFTFSRVRIGHIHFPPSGAGAAVISAAAEEKPHEVNEAYVCPPRAVSNGSHVYTCLSYVSRERSDLSLS